MRLTEHGQDLEDAATLRRVARELDEVARRRKAPGLRSIVDKLRSDARRIEGGRR